MMQMGAHRIADLILVTEEVVEIAVVKDAVAVAVVVVLAAAAEVVARGVEGDSPGAGTLRCLSDIRGLK